VSSVGFTAVRGNVGECFSNASFEGEPDVAKGNVRRWFYLNCLSTHFDDGVSSYWESNDDGRSWGESLVVVEGRKEGKN